MQYVDRGQIPPPAPFRGEAAKAERYDFLRYMGDTAERLSQTTPPPRRFELAQEETLSALYQLFKGKCAFCESRETLNAQLFRPPQEAEPLAKSEFAHLYYAWLRTDWGNAYAVCSACSLASRNRFPVEKLDRGPLPTYEQMEAFSNENYGLWRWEHQDRRNLLDPCENRNLAVHLSFNLSGEIEAFSKMGAQTIAVFALDRADLVKARASAFHSYVDLLKNELDRGMVPNVFDFASLEFGGGWNSLVRRILERVGHQTDETIRFRAERVGETMRRLWKTPLQRRALTLALEQVRDPVERNTVARPPSKGQPRRLVGVEVLNFKALQRLQLPLREAISPDAATGREAEASAVLVLGENAAGKSSILEAVALALMDARIRAKLARFPKHFVLDPSLMGSEEEASPPFATVTLNFAGGVDLTLTIGDNFEETGATDNLPPVFAYGAFRQYASRSPNKPPKGHVTTLFKSEALLANPEEWLLDLPQADFAMVARALQRILMIEGEFEIVQRDVANRRCLIVSKVGEGPEARHVKTPLRVVSSGFRSVLAMVCDVLAGLIALQPAGERKSFGEMEPVVLIDEVEAHLHPRWKMQIMTALRRVLPKAVMIATTHDPLCLRGMHDQEVIVFSRTLKADDESPEALPIFVETITALPNVEDLTIEQLLTSDFFSMFSTDAPATELRLAKFGDLVAKEAAKIDLTEAERSDLDHLRDQVLRALPLGSSEVERLIEEAVFEYLQKRRGSSRTQLDQLKTETRESILKALEAY